MSGVKWKWKCEDSLWPQGVEAVVNPQLAREVTEDRSEWRLQSIDPKAEALFSRSGEQRSLGQKMLGGGDDWGCKRLTY